MIIISDNKYEVIRCYIKAMCYSKRNERRNLNIRGISDKNSSKSISNF